MPPTFALLLSLLITVAGCDLFGGGDSLRVIAIPTSAVEMSLDIRTTKGGAVRITRDGHEVAKFTLNGKDSVFVDSGLSPATTYTWRVSSGGESVGVRAATMDTTSSQFTWQTFTFGGSAGSSVLYDVAIIDENNIWAVGEIYVLDEADINGYQLYNAVHWDGQKWELKRIPYIYQGQAFFNPIQTVFAFDSNNIWFAGNGVIYWDGIDFNPVAITQNAWGATKINKIWGASSMDLYIVGDIGSIAHYNGTSWRKIESGTDLHFYDIWGDVAVGKSKPEIIAVAADQFVSFDKKILRIEAATVRTISDLHIPHSIHSVWFVPSERYFISGSGMFAKPAYDARMSWQWLHPGVTVYYAYSVRGNAVNDVVAAGAFGEVLHFNGAAWKSHRGDTAISQGAYYGLAVKGDLVVAVGQDSPSAVVAIGKR